MIDKKEEEEKVPKNYFSLRFECFQSKTSHPSRPLRLRLWLLEICSGTVYKHLCVCVWGGGADAKKILSQTFLGPFRPQKFQGPPFCHKNYGSTGPTEEHVNSIFTGKFVVFFSRPPYKGQKFQGPPFCFRPPTSVCERSLLCL